MEMHTPLSLYATHGIAARTERGHALPDWVRRLLSAPSRLLRALKDECAIRRAIAELEQRDDRLLDDIGMPRHAIEPLVRGQRSRDGWGALAVVGLSAALSLAGGIPMAHANEPSVRHGERLAVIGGCHDCHTAGYAESGGAVDPAKALAGSSIGFRGPWGTSYASNLRLTAAGRTEDQFLDHARTFKALPPMPWFNVHAMDEEEIRSLYRYIRALGAPGGAVPLYVPPDEEPTTPYVSLMPVMPKPQ